jgi:hypothetical protein
MKYMCNIVYETCPFWEMLFFHLIIHQGYDVKL